MPSRNFIIICEIRTGSTYLSRFLDGVEGVHMWKESPHRDGSYEILRGSREPTKTLREHYSTPFSGIIGSKLPLRHIRKKTMLILEQVKALSLRPVYLTRENEIENILSIMYAENSNLWHLDGTHNRDPGLVEIDIEKVRKRYIPAYRHFLAQMNEIKEMLHVKDSIHITYESVVRGDGKQQIVDELGLEWKSEYEDISNEKKILGGGYRKYFLNYDEILDEIEEGLYV
jgi:LPS sulfotransferase NodH